MRVPLADPIGCLSDSLPPEGDVGHDDRASPYDMRASMSAPCRETVTRACQDLPPEGHSSFKVGKRCHLSCCLRRALYSQNDTGLPCVSKMWWQQAETRS